jgi:hypothetical protein
MRIAELRTEPNWVLSLVADDSRVGRFDVSPYLQYEAFEALRDQNEFTKVNNGGYFVEPDGFLERFRVAELGSENNFNIAAA